MCVDLRNRHRARCTACSLRAVFATSGFVRRERARVGCYHPGVGRLRGVCRRGRLPRGAQLAGSRLSPAAGQGAAQVHREGLACLLAARNAGVSAFPPEPVHRADSGRLRGDAPGHAQGKLAVAYVARHRSSLPGAVPRRRRRSSTLYARCRRGHQGGGHRRPVADGARALRASEPTQLLRSLVAAGARRHGEIVTIDVFASGDNSAVPRFFALYAEPTAEGVNAFAQPSWAVSHCPACG